MDQRQHNYSVRCGETNPCPFCEASGEHYIYTEKYDYSALGGNTFYRIQCAHCGARGPTADSRIDALSAWNRAAHWGVDEREFIEGLGAQLSQATLEIQ